MIVLEYTEVFQQRHRFTEDIRHHYARHDDACLVVTAYYTDGAHRGLPHIIIIDVCEPLWADGVHVITLPAWGDWSDGDSTMIVLMSGSHNIPELQRQAIKLFDRWQEGLTGILRREQPVCVDCQAQELKAGLQVAKEQTP